MDQILDRLQALPVIDVHTHFDHEADRFGYTMPQYFYHCSYGDCYEAGLSDAQRAALYGPDPRAQFSVLVQLMERLRFTKTGQFAARLAELAGFTLTEDAYDGLTAWYHRQDSRQSPQIRASVANSMGHPLYGGISGMEAFLSGTRVAGQGIFRSMTVTDLHNISSRGQLQVLARISGHPIDSLRDWEEACRDLLYRAASVGVCAYKELFLYFRSAEITLPDQKKAAAEFDDVLRGKPATANLKDALLFRLYDLISGTGLPVQIHTGATLSTAETALKLTELIKVLQSFPGISFDLLHLNYPLLDLYEVVLRTCPNTWGDATWTVTTDSGYTERYLGFALDVLPPERTLFFGSDRHCGGLPVTVALEQSEQVLAAFLADRIAHQQLSLSTAEELAACWLYHGPKAFFHL